MFDVQHLPRWDAAAAQVGEVTAQTRRIPIAFDHPPHALRAHIAAQVLLRLRRRRLRAERTFSPAQRTLPLMRRTAFSKHGGPTDAAVGQRGDLVVRGFPNNDKPTLTTDNASDFLSPLPHSSNAPALRDGTGNGAVNIPIQTALHRRFSVALAPENALTLKTELTITTHCFTVF